MGKGTSKIKGTAKKIGAALSGDAGILKTLEGEHAEVSTLMKDLLDAGDDIDKRAKLYPTIRKKLLVHSKGEEIDFYPECHRHPDLVTTTDQAEGEHKEVEQMIVDLDRTPIDAPAWIDMFRTLRNNVEAHVEMEENQLFPAVKEAFSKDKLRAMDDEYKERKKGLEKRISDIDVTSRARADTQPMR